MREIEFRVWDSRKKSYFNKKDIAIDNKEVEGLSQ